MTFARVDDKKFYEMTKAHTNELMAIMIDEMVFGAPNIKEPIGGGRVRIELGNSDSRRSRGQRTRCCSEEWCAASPSERCEAPWDHRLGPTPLKRVSCR